MSTLGCSGWQMMCPLRCVTEQVFLEKGREERQVEDSYGILWPQWRETEPQWFLTLKLLSPSLSSAARHLLLLLPYPLSTLWLLPLLALCKLWQPQWRVQDKKSAEQRKERQLMHRYCIRCMCSLRDGRMPVLCIPLFSHLEAKRACFPC